MSPSNGQSSIDFRTYAAGELNALLNRLASRHYAELVSVKAVPDSLEENLHNDAFEKTLFKVGDPHPDDSRIKHEALMVGSEVVSRGQASTPATPISPGDIGPEVIFTKSQNVESSSYKKKHLVLDILEPEVERGASEDTKNSMDSASSRCDSAASRCVDNVSSRDVEKVDSLQTFNSVATRSTRTGASKKVRLRVSIISAFGLRDADMMVGQGVSDPYCICRIKRKPHTEFRTQVIQDNLNPVWNHQCVIADYDEGDDIEFLVMDKDNFKEDDLLGRATLHSDEFSSKGFTGLLKLDRGGTIRIKLVLELNDHGHIKALLHKAQQIWLPLDALSPLSPSSGDQFQATSTHNHHATFGFHVPFNLQQLSDGFRDESLFQRCVYPPSSNTRVCWNMFGLLLVMYDFAIIPYTQAFNIEIDNPMFLLLLIIASFWTLDMLTTFCAGIEEHGVSEMRFKVIAGRYIKTWFLVDFVLVSIDWFYVVLTLMELSSKASAGKGFRLLKSARSVRTVRSLTMLRVWKLGTSLGGLLSSIRKPVLVASLQLFEALVVLVGMTHLVACIWYALGNSEHHSWTWLKEFNMDEKTLAYRYSTSVHWAVTQFTPASSEIMPTNTTERVFTVVVDFMGLIAFSTFVSTITQKMTMIREIRSQSYEQREKLTRFIEQHKISLELGSRLVIFNRQRKVQMDDRLSEKQIEILQELPESLRKELHKEMFSRVLCQHPFFKVICRLDPWGMEELYEAGLNIRITFEAEDVFAYGEISRCMYFVNYGSYLYIRLGERFKLLPGDWLGEPGLWVDGWVHRGAFTSSEHGEIVCLNNVIFKEKIVRKDIPQHVRRFIRGYVSDFVRLQTNSPHSSLHTHSSVSADVGNQGTSDSADRKSTEWDTAHSSKTKEGIETPTPRKSSKSQASRGDFRASMSVNRLKSVHHMIQLSDVWGTVEDLMVFAQSSIRLAGVQKNVSRVFTPSASEESK